MPFFRSLLLALLTASVLAAAPPPERPAWTTSRVRGAPEPPAPYRVVPVLGARRFDKPTCVSQVPGRGLLFVGELGGRILSVPKLASSRRADLAIDLGARAGGRVSLFDLAFHPKFESNRQIFVCYVHHQLREPGTLVSRFTVNLDGAPRLEAESEVVILTWPSGGHNGGCLRFGPDGNLYISTGDGAGPNPPDRNKAGQDLSNLWACILRIDVDRRADGKNYAVPEDNPFMDTAGARPEIWAYGFRNPWKMGVDPRNGDLWVGDVGWETWEMVHRVRRGENHGWSVMESRLPCRTEIPRGPTAIVPPVKDHPRHEANSITGGVVHGGKRLSDLAGAFVYGDYVTGKIWSLRAEASDETRYTSRELVDTDLRIIAFAEGSDGELYVLDHDYTGQLYELRARLPGAERAPFPRKLSETGLFTSTSEQRPAPGVLPYSIVAEPWMDGATAQRWIALPGSSKIDLKRSSELRDWEFPDGAVFVRTLSLDVEGQKRRVETQLLHHEGGTWRPYSYAWNEDHSEADLLEPGGDTVELGATNHRRSWRTWGRGECVLCHNVQIGSVLGFELAQLDCDVEHDGQSRNQLELLRHAGVFEGASDEVVERRVDLHDPDDTAARLNDRARSYLHVNCGVCHHHGGDSTITIFFRRSLKLPQTQTMRPPNVGTFGITEPRILSPGDPLGSILLYRMSKLGYARMPHVGSRVVDSRGAALLHDWIVGLKEGGDTARVSENDQRALRQLIDLESPREIRDGAIHQLLQTSRGAMAIVQRIHRGELRPSTVQRTLELVRGRPSDMRGLFETFLPDSETRKVLGPMIDPDLILRTEGDAARGELIYFSDSVTCKTCHPLGGKERPVGPDLRGVGKKYPRVDMLRHILKPSFEVAPEFATYLLVEESGATHTGVLTRQTDTEVVLTTAARETVRVAAADVKLLSKQSKSLMPELLLRDLTAQEASDLLEFLLSQREDPSK